MGFEDEVNVGSRNSSISLSIESSVVDLLSAFKILLASFIFVPPIE